MPGTKAYQKRDSKPSVKGRRTPIYTKAFDLPYGWPKMKLAWDMASNQLALLQISHLKRSRRLYEAGKPYLFVPQQAWPSQLNFSEKMATTSILLEKGYIKFKNVCQKKHCKTCESHPLGKCHAAEADETSINQVLKEVHKLSKKSTQKHMSKMGILILAEEDPAFPLNCALEWPSFSVQAAFLSGLDDPDKAREIMEDFLVLCPSDPSERKPGMFYTNTNDFGCIMGRSKRGFRIRFLNAFEGDPKDEEILPLSRFVNHKGQTIAYDFSKDATPPSPELLPLVKFLKKQSKLAGLKTREESKLAAKKWEESYAYEESDDDSKVPPAVTTLAKDSRDSSKSNDSSKDNGNDSSVSSSDGNDGSGREDSSGGGASDGSGGSSSSSDSSSSGGGGSDDDNNDKNNDDDKKDDSSDGNRDDKDESKQKPNEIEISDEEEEENDASDAENGANDDEKEVAFSLDHTPTHRRSKKSKSSAADSGSRRKQAKSGSSMFFKRDGLDPNGSLNGLSHSAMMSADDAGVNVHLKRARSHSSFSQSVSAASSSPLMASNVSKKRSRDSNVESMLKKSSKSGGWEDCITGTADWGDKKLAKRIDGVRFIPIKANEMQVYDISVEPKWDVKERQLRAMYAKQSGLIAENEFKEQLKHMEKKRQDWIRYKLTLKLKDSEDEEKSKLRRGQTGRTIKGNLRMRSHLDGLTRDYDFRGKAAHHCPSNPRSARVSGFTDDKIDLAMAAWPDEYIAAICAAVGEPIPPDPWGWYRVQGWTPLEEKYMLRIVIASVQIVLMNDMSVTHTMGSAWYNLWIGAMIKCGMGRAFQALRDKCRSQANIETLRKAGAQVKDYKFRMWITEYSAHYKELARLGCVKSSGSQATGEQSTNSEPLEELSALMDANNDEFDDRTGTSPDLPTGTDPKKEEISRFNRFLKQSFDLLRPATATGKTEEVDLTGDSSEDDTEMRSASSHSRRKDQDLLILDEYEGVSDSSERIGPFLRGYYRFPPMPARALPTTLTYSNVRSALNRENDGVSSLRDICDVAQRAIDGSDNRGLDESQLSAQLSKCGGHLSANNKTGPRFCPKFPKPTWEEKAKSKSPSKARSATPGPKSAAIAKERKKAESKSKSSKSKDKKQKSKEKSKSKKKKSKTVPTNPLVSGSGSGSSSKKRDFSGMKSSDATVLGIISEERPKSSSKSRRSADRSLEFKIKLMEERDWADRSSLMNTNAIRDHMRVFTLWMDTFGIEKYNVWCSMRDKNLDTRVLREQIAELARNRPDLVISNQRSAPSRTSSTSSSSSSSSRSSGSSFGGSSMMSTMFQSSDNASEPQRTSTIHGRKRARTRETRRVGVGKSPKNSPEALAASSSTASSSSSSSMQ